MRSTLLIPIVSLVLFTLVSTGCATHTVSINAQPRRDYREPPLPDAEVVSRMVENWHLAAANGNYKEYFDRMTPRAVFIGTDATERWVGREFQDFARPYFDGVEAWTYEATSRNVYVAQQGRTAWFDELLDSASYGTARGSGVAIKGGDGRWRIAHYTLHFPIPNDLAGDITQQIADFEKARRGGDN